jgi:hypothetical protein
MSKPVTLGKRNLVSEFTTIRCREGGLAPSCCAGQFCSRKGRPTLAKVPAKQVAKTSVGVLDWIGRYQVVQWLIAAAKTTVLPAGLSVVTAYAGWAGGVPLMWIALAAVLVFAGTINALYYLMSYSRVITPENKLRYVNTIVPIDLSAVSNSRRAAQAQLVNHQRGISRIQVGVILQNMAHFPISAYIEHAETEMDGQTPPRASYPKPPITIVPGNNVFMLDHPIEMNNRKCDHLEGRIDMTICYGKQGKERYKLGFKGKVEIFIETNGVVRALYTHWDTNQV